MKMILRWYGTKHDTVSLEHIGQIPGVSGIAGTLMDKQAGELWTLEEVTALRDEVAAAGLAMEVIESVNIHDDIKLGLPSRDKYIENYKKTIENLGKIGVKVICYNFMPVFDWARTELHKELPDGSNTMAYEHHILKAMKDPADIIEKIRSGSDGFSMPGWEPERLAEIEHLFEQYADITSEKLYENLKYFLEQMIPICEKSDVKMAIHPDDPPWEIFGLPRVFSDEASGNTIINLVNSPYNGLTLCTGSIGVNEANDVPAIIRALGDRIHFAHIRNFKKTGSKDFYESSHRSTDGTLDMFEVMKALYHSAPDCYIRPDHGRMIWGEQARPGYGLYDRALGVVYLEGIWESLEKTSKP